MQNFTIPLRYNVIQFFLTKIAFHCLYTNKLQSSHITKCGMQRNQKKKTQALRKNEKINPFFATNCNDFCVKNACKPNAQNAKKFVLLNEKKNVKTRTLIKYIFFNEKCSLYTKKPKKRE